jgi:flagellar biosynthesis protein FlhA
VVFIILTIINFVVITKGAGRISEVTARFTLDAMPGKQMAIDADLNAGLITQDEARVRRGEVRAEADFYGSMDGASKFVARRRHRRHPDPADQHPRRHRDRAADARHELWRCRFGLYVADDRATASRRRSGRCCLDRRGRHRHPYRAREQDMGQEVSRQLFGDLRMLYICAGVSGVLGIIPGMPKPDVPRGSRDLR